MILAIGFFLSCVGALTIGVIESCELNDVPISGAVARVLVCLACLLIPGLLMCIASLAIHIATNGNMP